MGFASTAATTAGNTAAGFGGDASSISGQLMPYLTGQLLHPTGYSQQDQTQMLNQAQAGAGGATSGITGQAALMAARSRNPSGFAGSLDEAARLKDKAAASSSEGIAANNAGVKLDQQQSAAKNLGSMYGQDTDAMLKSMGIQSEDIKEADQDTWLNKAEGVLNSLSNGAKGAGAVMAGM